MIRPLPPPCSVGSRRNGSGVPGRRTLPILTLFPNAGPSLTPACTGAQQQKRRRRLATDASGAALTAQLFSTCRSWRIFSPAGLLMYSPEGFMRVKINNLQVPKAAILVLSRCSSPLPRQGCLAQSSRRGGQLPARGAAASSGRSPTGTLVPLPGKLSRFQGHNPTARDTVPLPGLQAVPQELSLLPLPHHIPLEISSIVFSLVFFFLYFTES